MGLPRLSTTATTLTTDATTHLSTVTSVSKSLTTESGTVKTHSVTLKSTVSTTSFTTPSMTVPPSSNNPYISKTTSPSGTVFIAFGSIALFLLIATYLAYLFNSWRAKRATLNQEIHYDSEYKGGYNYNPEQQQQQQQSVVPLLRNEPSNFNFQNSPYQGGSTVNLQRPTDVTKMFISPTAEVLNVRNSTMFQDSSTSSPLRTPYDSPVQFQHSRNGSRVGVNSETGSTKYSSNLRETRGRGDNKVIPSMYLDDMLEDDDD